MSAEVPHHSEAETTTHPESLPPISIADIVSKVANASQVKPPTNVDTRSFEERSAEIEAYHKERSQIAWDALKRQMRWK